MKINIALCIPCCFLFGSFFLTSRREVDYGAERDLTHICTAPGR